MRTPILERPFFVAIRGLTLTVFVVAIPVAALFWKGVPPWLEAAIFGPAASSAADDETPSLPTISLGGSPAMLTASSENATTSPPQAALRQGRTLYSEDVAVSPVHYATTLLATEGAGSGVRENVNGHGSVHGAGVDTMATQQTLVAELERLGAQYYRLEKWGDDGNLYRLSCLVSPPGMSHYQKHFQAIDNDGAKVLAQVIAQITQWHHEMAAIRE